MPMCMRMFRSLDQLAIIDRLELINVLLFKQLNQMQMMWKFRFARYEPSRQRKKNTIAKKTLKTHPRMPPQQT